MKIKGQYLEWSCVYKACLERGRWLNCGWNGVRLKSYPNTCSSFIGQYPSPEYPAPHPPTDTHPTPGLQIWHGTRELESKTHNFYMHFLFKQTYIQIINSFHYLNLFVYYTEEKNVVDKICVNTLIRKWKINSTNERSIIGSKWKILLKSLRDHFNRCQKICSNQTWNKNLFDVTVYAENMQDVIFTHARYVVST